MSRHILLGFVLIPCAIGAEAPAGKDIPPPRKVAPRTDRYGDPLPPGAVARLGTGRFRHVENFAFSPDGRTVLTGQGPTFRLCDVGSGKVRLTFMLSDDFSGVSVAYLTAFSPDGRTVALGDRAVISLRDVHSGKELARLAPAKHGAFAAGGGRFVYWDDRTVRVCQTDTGKLIRRWALPAGSADGSMDLSADGSLLAIGDADGVRAWETATGREVKTPPGLRVPMGRIKFAPASRVLFALRSDDSAVHVWNVATGKERSIRLPHPLWLIELSPDGNLLAAIERDRWIRLWKTSSGREVGLLDAGEEIQDFAFAPDGRTLAVRTGGAFRLWDVTTRKPLRRFAGKLFPETGRTKTTFSPDGKVLAGLDGEAQPRLRVWHVATGREIDQPEGHFAEVRALAFSANDRIVATADHYGSIRVWETLTGRPLRRLRGHEGFVWPLALAPAGDLLASYGHDDFEVRLWDVSTGRELCHFGQLTRLTLKGANEGCTLRLSSDGKMVATEAGRRPSIDFRDVRSGKVRYTVREQGYLYTFALAPDGKTLAVFGNRTHLLGKDSIYLWDLAGKKSRPTLSWRAGDGACCPGADYVFFSPDGRLLAALSGFRLSVWEVNTGGLVASLKHGHPWEAVGFTPNGRVLGVVPCVWPKRGLEVWDLLEGKEIHRLRMPGASARVSVFSPDARLLATGMTDSTILIWDLGFLTSSAWKPATRLGGAELNRLWRELAGTDAARAYRAVRALRASPESAVSFLAGRLPPAADERYTLLIRGLDSESFTERQAAFRELSRLGLKAEAALRAVLKGKPSLEVRRRVEALLARLDGPPPTAEVLRQGRALAVLEQVGTPAAAAVLKRLAGGAAEARLTQEAKAALRRLERRSMSKP